MPTDPSDPSTPNPSTRLYQTTPDSPKGGGGGIFVIVLLLLLLGGGAAYYFLIYKPGAAAPAANVTTAATPAKVATPKSAAASPTPDTSGNPTYNNAQRGQYIQQAGDAFVALRKAKTQPFTDVSNALNAAGGFSAVGLTSKPLIAARRELVAKCIAANDDAEEFLKTQEATYKAELQKTPLIPNDVNITVDDFAFKAQTEKNVKVRDLERDSLKTGDEMLTYLDKTFGSWTINAAQHLTFTKKLPDLNSFGALQKTYGDQVASMNTIQKEIKAITDPNATPIPDSPAASVAPVSATPSPAASAKP